ncbi:DUF3999 domain-containing protein [Desulfomicrobium escambiense]|uniref:DUF3999 domain-containing protein n=1 Tax=Desulfomicrobium escambiense TaxID=29503 RepID=UPI0003F8025C|nr:DUF3999 domain-containing protein [Desulfomicrobium escambiense]
MIFVLLLALLIPVSAFAVSPMDFAGGFVLEAGPGHSLQRLELPFAVYNASARADLGDVRVFNAAGEEVPMHLRRVAAEPVPAVSLPLFRLGPVRGSGDVDFRLQVRTSERGAVVETLVRPSAGESRMILLDATAAPSGLGALRFGLGGGDTMLRVAVRGSDDLATWRDAGGGVLARMEHPGGRILQDRVELSGRAWKYYLLSADQDLSGLESALGEAGTGQAVRRFVPLAGAVVESGTYEYALPAGLPVDLLDLGGDEDSVVGVEVFTPSGDGWRSAARGTLFRLTVDGQRLAGPGLPLRGTLPRLRVAMQGTPEPLRAGWLPHELVFMAQGAGPYTLAVGNPGVQPGKDLLAPMLAGGRADAPMGRAVLGEWRSLGGEGRLKPPLEYTKIALWAVLGLGVALLGAMAWHLARGMDGAGRA